jgi:hypothetical protein
VDLEQDDPHLRRAAVGSRRHASEGGHADRQQRLHLRLQRSVRREPLHHHRGVGSRRAQQLQQPSHLVERVSGHILVKRDEVTAATTQQA